MQAKKLYKQVGQELDAHLLSETDAEYRGGVLILPASIAKGMEFDAVAVVWPEVALTSGERRRLYTAASRALHALAVLGGDGVVREMGKF